MTCFRSALCAAILCGLCGAAPAAAQIVELGATATPVAAPICPASVPKASCTIILTETTALETIADKISYPTTVTQPGRIVAYTVGLAKLTKADITGLNSRYGGTSQIAITVLRPGKKRAFTVVAESPLRHVTPWFGQVVQFPLEASLEVKAGDVVALTVPTWAPVLAIGLPSKQFQYRASRPDRCTTFDFQTAQLTIGASTQYRCFYVGTRVEYSATEVTYPAVPKNSVNRGVDRRRRNR